MRISIHDSDKNGFPNLALMKLSAHHKARGDEVQNLFVDFLCREDDDDAGMDD